MDFTTALKVLEGIQEEIKRAIEAREKGGHHDWVKYSKVRIYLGELTEDSVPQVLDGDASTVWVTAVGDSEQLLPEYVLKEDDSLRYCEEQAKRELGLK
ncbi:hypothetical protein [Streptomyces sp. 769]|uniref:hypothetical protein n=1 Tax=Streptomyces sp. 769 TaxID=1262452 RepID=UPI00057EFE99|nr:hypothetical protein [Streptomyces sp. 769]AJC58556.1 hypothetical protein GZL_05983 [Streptomyces sp. 769]